MKLVLSILTACLVLAYPFLIYWGLTRFDARLAAGVMFGLFALRLVVQRASHRGHKLMNFTPVFVAVSAICLTVFLLDDSSYFLYHPVLINGIFLVSFALTLRSPPNMIARFAALTEPDFPPEGVAYCRKVTLVWCGFFILNGSTALVTALWTSLKTWTLYNGFISYLLMGLLFAIEYIIRLRVKKQHQARREAEGPDWFEKTRGDHA